jgi:hypothetical protein
VKRKVSTRQWRKRREGKKDGSIHDNQTFIQNDIEPAFFRQVPEKLGEEEYFTSTISPSILDVLGRSPQEQPPVSADPCVIGGKSKEMLFAIECLGWNTANE